MILSSIAELPFFEQYESNREKILVELEQYNDTRINNTIADIVNDTPNGKNLNSLNVVNRNGSNNVAIEKNYKGKKCCK